jgi:maltose O-acetyltransferase
VKALREIGLGRAARFGFFTLAMVAYRLMLFPQLRVAFLRILGARIGAGTILQDVRFFNLYRRGFAGLSVGADCFIGDECLLDLAEEIRIEDKVTIAERVVILTHTNVGYKDHPLQERFPAFAASVVLRAGSFVGASTTILPGVVVGPRAFVAAGSVVTKNVPEETLVGGVPARPLRTLAE